MYVKYYGCKKIRIVTKNIPAVVTATKNIDMSKAYMTFYI